MLYESFIKTPAEVKEPVVRYVEFSARNKKNDIVYDFQLLQYITGKVEAFRYSKVRKNNKYVYISMPQIYHCNDFFGCLADFKQKTDPF